MVAFVGSMNEDVRGDFFVDERVGVRCTLGDNEMTASLVANAPQSGKLIM